MIEIISTSRPDAGFLILTCRKCTRMAEIVSPSREESDDIALAKGWVVDGERMVCPKCPAAMRMESQVAAYARLQMRAQLKSA